MHTNLLEPTPHYRAIAVPGSFPETWSTGHLSAVTRWLLDWADGDAAPWRDALERPADLSPERSKLERIAAKNFYQYVKVCASFVLEDADFWEEQGVLAQTMSARRVIEDPVYVDAQEQATPRARERACPRGARFLGRVG